MTTTPTPERIKEWRVMCLANLACDAVEALIVERDELRKDLHHIRVDDGKHIAGIIAERDQALARVKELEAEPGSFASWVAERHRAEKAEARVAQLEAHFASCQECSNCLKECGHD